MAIAATALTSGTNTSTATNPVSTASVTPHSSRLQLLLVASGAVSGTPAAPTVTGCSLTWVQAASVIWTGTPSAAISAQRLTLFRAMGTPTTGTLSITKAENGRLAWALSEFSGVSTAGTNGSAAIAQIITAEDETENDVLTDTGILGAFSSAANATFGGFETTLPMNTSAKVGAGFTKLHTIGTGYFQNILTEWQTANDTTVDAYHSYGGGAYPWLIIAAEIGDAASTQNLTATAIVSEEVLGTPTVGFRVEPASITTEESLGSPVVGAFIVPTSIASLESFGVVDVSGGSVTLSPSSIASAESIGALSVYAPVYPSSIETSQELGEPEVTQFLVGAFLGSTEDGPKARIEGYDQQAG